MKTNMPRFLTTLVIALASPIAIFCVDSEANAQLAVPQVAARLNVCNQIGSLSNSDPSNSELQLALIDCNYLVQAFNTCQTVEAAQFPPPPDIFGNCAGEIVGQITPTICAVTSSYLGEAYLEGIDECY